MILEFCFTDDYLLGRDTPSSQITEGEEGRGGEEEIRGSANEHRQVVPSVSKQSRSDIDDKFGKFEIKKQEVLGDETKSLVSDTWSTDVLASDSETVEQSERNFPRPPEADGPPHPFIQVYLFKSCLQNFLRRRFSF